MWEWGVFVKAETEVIEWVPQNHKRCLIDSTTLNITAITLPLLN